MNQYAAMSTKPTAQIICDLRSDTVTRPDAAMRKAMAEAEVGDDVFGDDPTVNRLESTLAERLGKDAGLFLSSGTQSNFVGLLAHCARGEEIVTGRAYHIHKYEAKGASVLGGIAFEPLDVADDGALEAKAIAAAVKDDDPHMPVTRLLGLENTHNGMAIPLTRLGDAVQAGRDAGLAVHLDGARYFNAVAALNCPERALADMFDSISICLSKGLGTPVGSVLVGPRDLIARARRWRKMLGGGMRQAGVLAAAGLYALDQNISRLCDDHTRATALADVLREYGDVQHATNMIFFTPPGGVTADLPQHMAAHGVQLTGATGTTRLVLHKDVTDDGLHAAIDGFRSFFGG
ncbi:low-specificity L-threonine aldolase [Tateyamaria omphalii]|uniref:Low-specificity L-threonine aldolase n=1 Tax=Tateyamaria omphalii TaxID=299262 RepID=A0A1P8N0X4_9RHOB|nr:low-specificity L-threonine aldolase [Tateyamaria omphalii]APX13902.1 low-specificity L-threonine aldolase [Tateyamaria omphalii]